ncbi:type 4 prepilin peptidase 1 . Aspartic peptidase. MEROPS family A24A [Caloranaerobacter azorensis DSM 13643]|uniref:Prepilin leader peptidase/N-methyltransferase n=1 Tax=Caloranaerobacter azorensis DSM 13643 TaxID=1121264 RepID=A0A1M5RWE0_9FIRM|nr:A24 family peptidase [Caloranaerobacter azorensis]SHH30520.1 type 4 prepilin peptidase 1 . Aspartic peptidase. MEROPS family A24A [Caloranaerobacter azorensis DSM 13643]
MYIFITGLIIGSFLNVCIYRIPKGESIVYPPSHCTNCNTRLKAIDLIPVFSYLLNKGRCRYCGERISLQYPFIEIFNGLICLLLFYKFGLSFNLIKYLFLTSLLIVISVIDYKHQIIPNSILLFGFFTILIFKLLYYSKAELLNSILGLLIGGLIFSIIVIVSRGGMGGGDIRLIALLGFFFGWKHLLLLMLLSFVIGAFFSIMLLLLKIKSMKDFIPFGPFISIAAIITIFYGDTLISYYINYFFNYMG